MKTISHGKTHAMSSHRPFGVLILLIAFALGSGCATEHRYKGVGHDFDVFFFTEPPGAPVWVVGNRTWEKRKAELMDAKPEDLKKYKLPKSSPCSAALSGRQVVMTRDATGETLFEEFEPGDVESITFDFATKKATDKPRAATP
jgi:hypothetical protein